MKRSLWIVAVLVVPFIGGVVAHNTGLGQLPQPKPGPGESGPGEGGATLRLPGLDPTPTVPARTALPDYIPKGNSSFGSAYPTAQQPGGSKIALPPSNAVDLNRDIEIKPEAGPWAVFVMAYNGPKSPEMARKMVTELRAAYKYPAYVFNYGREEKRKEYERVQKLRQDQIEALQKANLKVDGPIRIRTIRIDEQTGVLIGGFRTREEAAVFVEKLRRVAPPDPEKVDLDTKFWVDTKPNAQGKVQGQAICVNPFLKALAVRNPTAGKEHAADSLEADLKLLRKLNVDEPLSLFQCKKPFTLAIKEFKTQHRSFTDAREAKGVVTQFGFSLRGEWSDHAANNAHNLAEALRKGGLPETYVLHSKYSSYVTVGGYDACSSENDSKQGPQMAAMQNFLENRFRSEAYRQLDLFQRPIPMQVPR
jgi:hypothetical protein